MKKTKGLSVLAGLAAVLLMTGLDQWTKYLATIHLKGTPGIALWPGVFELIYVENKGAAFGLLQNQRTLFLILTTAVLLVIGAIYFRMPLTRRFLPMRFTMILLMAGAAGNFIDRIRLEYVVDFFYFRLIDFPVFNVADCFVTIGAVLLFLLVFFYYKDEEFFQCLGLKGKKE